MHLNNISALAVLLFAIICCKFLRCYLVLLPWFSKASSKKCWMHSGPEHPKVALRVSKAQVTKANYAQAEALTKDAGGCSKGKIDHWKAKNSHCCLCKCYLIVISS